MKRFAPLQGAWLAVLVVIAISCTKTELVEVIKEVPVEVTQVSAIELDKTGAYIKTGETLKLTATVNPEDASEPTVTWASSNEAIALVAEGLVTAVANGTATITAKAGNEKTAACEITVGPNIYVLGKKNGMGVVFKNGENVLYGLESNFQSNYLPNQFGMAFSGGSIYSLVTKEKTVTNEWGYDEQKPFPFVYTNEKGSQVTAGSAKAYGIAVDGKDVYVAGVEQISYEADYSWGGSGSTTADKAYVWKNGEIYYEYTHPGIAQRKDGASSQANGVYVYNGSVYELLAINDVQSFSYPQPVAHVAKDGQIIYTIAEGTEGAYTQSSAMYDMAFSGSDVYTIGYVSDPVTYITVYGVWKNGALAYTLSEKAVDLSDIAISGNGDVYVVGYLSLGQDASWNEVYGAYVWKNGEPALLAGDMAKGVSAKAVGLQVVGEDVYVVGYQTKPSFAEAGVSQFNQMVVWKNAEPIAFPAPADASIFDNTQGFSIAVEE